MDQHYSECDKHKEIYWHTITWGENCPLCKMESHQNLAKPDDYPQLSEVPKLTDAECDELRGDLGVAIGAYEGSLDDNRDPDEVIRMWWHKVVLRHFA